MITKLVLLLRIILCPDCSFNRYYPFNSHEWSRQNFSLQYQYHLNQISDENKEKYELRDN